MICPNETGLGPDDSAPSIVTAEIVETVEMIERRRALAQPPDHLQFRLRTLLAVVTGWCVLAAILSAIGIGPGHALLALCVMTCVALVTAALVEASDMPMEIRYYDESRDGSTGLARKDRTAF